MSWETTWDKIMVEAVELSNRLGRDVVIMKNYPAGFSVRTLIQVDPIKGNIVTPGTPLTQAQLLLKEAKVK